MLRRIINWLLRKPRRATKAEAKKTVELMEKYKRWSKEEKR